MKPKVVGAILAGVPVGLLGWAMVNSYGLNLHSVSAQRMTTYDIRQSAPSQDKFEMREALRESSRPLATPSVMAAAEAAKDAAEAAQDAADAGREAAAVAASHDTESTLAHRAIVPGLPRIAYVYTFGYRLESDLIPDLQRKHADYCERQGPLVCRIVSLEQSGQEGDYGGGKLELAVAAPRARGFGAELAKQAEAAGGKEIASSIEGEDLSKAIVDTEARLRARILLRDRLMEVLATRRGTVSELVEAERGVADVNEEIDQARSWLNEMSSRVEFSRMTIDYAAALPREGAFTSPVRSMLGNVGAILGSMLALLIALLTIGGPLAALAWGARKAWLRLRPAKPDEAEAVPA